MKRYWLPTLLGILMLLTLTACGNPPAEETPAETAHVHAWGEWVETAPPSCTDEGKHERTCAACGETETKLIHPFGHRESAWITDPNRTCLIESAKHTMCITCGEILQTEIIYAEGHRESDWIIDQKATCTTDGARHKVCNTCNQTTLTEIISALGHTVGDWIEDHAVTCTTDGARHKTCTTCGATTETETLYATGHQNGDWIVDKKPTCTLDGVRHKQCTVCGETNATETLHATGHQVGNWIIDRAATCTVDGARHKTCAVCGITTLSEKTYATGHTPGAWVTDRVATCALSGIRHQSCTKCEETLNTETITVPHTEVVDLATPATCQATGLTEGKHCSVCQTVIVEQLSLDMTDHTYGQDGLCTSCHITDERYLDFTWKLDGTYSVSAKEGVEMPSHLIIPVTYKGKAVTKIKDNAFENCNTLQSITIPDSITVIGEFAFAHCRALKSITVPEGVSEIQQKTFYECSGLTEVNLPESVTKFGAAAFAGCASLTDIAIPSGVTELDGSMFGSCGFTHFTVPDHIKTIGTYVFTGCTNLTSVTMFDSVTKIGKEAFTETPLKDIYYSGTDSDWAKISIQEPNDELNAAARHYQDANAYLLFTKNGNSYEVRAKDVNNLPETLIIPAKYEGFPVNSIANNAFEGALSLKKVVIQEGVTTIRSNAFRDCINLTSVILPQTLTTIDYNAFRDCTNLTSLTLPESLTAFGDFYTGLPEEVFNTDEQGNRYLGTASKPYLILIAVRSQNSSTSFVTHPDTAYISSYAFDNCNKLVDITFSEGVRYIGQTAISSCPNLKTLSLPSTLTHIDPFGLFWHCPNLTTITVADDNPTFASIGNCIIDKTTKTLIAGCESSVIPADGSVTAIDRGAFQSIELTELVIPEGITDIQNSAFRYCRQLTSVVIPSTVKTIDREVFAGCHALTSLTVAEGNPYFTAQNNNIIRISDSTLVASASDVVPEGVKRIQTGTFYTSQIKQITLPLSLTEIEEFTFDYCENLTDVYYAGTAEQWAKVKIGEQNESLLNAKIHFSSTAP